MKLRYYQTEAINALIEFFKAHPEPDRNPVVAMPTGTGKAVVIAWFIRLVCEWWPGQRIMMLTHVKELIEQNADKMKTVWPQAPLGVYSAGLGEKVHYMPITFAGIQSARNQAKLFGKQDIVLIDECHLVSPDDEASYKAFLGELRKINPAIRFVGLSATCYRLGLGMITENGVFTDICYDITSRSAFNRLIDEGFLSLLIPMRTQATLSVAGVKKRGGEFVEKDLQQAVVKYDLTYDALSEAADRAADRSHWLIYATGIEHVDMICGILTDLGITSVPVHSKLSDYERDDNIARFKAGQVRALVNANILTTGFDFPALDCIILLRPTNSPVLHVQILGRGTRPYYADGFDLETTEGRLAAIDAGPKQNCLVLDFAGNTQRLGPINDPRIPKKKGEGTGDVPVKACNHCGCLNHISARVCDNCGQPFTIDEKITPSASTLDLVVRDTPLVQEFDVQRVTYEQIKAFHPGRPPSLRVSYFCGVRRFTELVCLEHHGSQIIYRAQDWWRKRIDMEPPLSIAEALPYVDRLRVPKVIRVWVNTKHPKVMSHVFTEEPLNV